MLRKRQPLSVELGPGIMDTIFDGIQRPLSDIAELAKDCFIPRGVDVAALNATKLWQFTPGGYKEGDLISGGDIFGTVYFLQFVSKFLYPLYFLTSQVFENEIISKHKIMCPPHVYGEIVKVYGAGTDGKDQFHLNETVLEVYNESQDRTHKLSLSHFWPVRRPRPVLEKMPANAALTTGLRCIDAVFPSVLGGTCAVPGAFGCGKTVISQSLSKFSNSDAIVYVGCGERGNEMAEVRLRLSHLLRRVIFILANPTRRLTVIFLKVLAEFPELTMTFNGKEVN